MAAPGGPGHGGSSSNDAAATVERVLKAKDFYEMLNIDRRSFDKDTLRKNYLVVCLMCICVDGW